MADVAGGGRVSVGMVADAKQGNRAVINIAPFADANRGEIEERVRDRMKYYPIPYAIEWASPESAHSTLA